MTHWASLANLTEVDQKIKVRPGDRFVDDGDVITAVGVSAAVDLALHLVGRLVSVGAAGAGVALHAVRAVRCARADRRITGVVVMLLGVFA